jgi:hypothetical protein
MEAVIKNVECQWLDDVLYGDFNNRVSGSSHEDAEFQQQPVGKDPSHNYCSSSYIFLSIL